VALLVVLPAAARQLDDDVTVKVGQTVRLKTFFNRDRKYTIVMSGVVTLTPRSTGPTVFYDPFYASASSSVCPSTSPSVFLQIKDAHANVIDFSTAGRPRCRPDHRYEFQVNDAYPPAYDLDGGANAYVALDPGSTWTASGSFSLVVRSAEPRRDVVFKVRAKKEFVVSVKDPLLADVRLSGTGRIADLDGARTTSGLFQATLAWLTRDDTLLTLKPTGTWRYNSGRRAVQGPVRVVRSSDGTCLKKSGLTMTVNKLAGSASLTLNECNGLTKAYWSVKKSDLSLSVEERRLG
jgi:hypothetical protein